MKFDKMKYHRTAGAVISSVLLFSAAFSCGNLLMMQPLTAFAEDEDIVAQNGFIFSVDADCATVEAYNGIESELQIPAECCGKPVTGIAYGVFQDNTDLISVAIPQSVKTISAKAFSGCTNLILITLQEGVETLGSNAFSGAAIEKIRIPESVTAINYEAFSECENLKRITILSRKCTIEDNPDTIYETAVIRCCQDSTAQAYGEKYGRMLELIGADPVIKGDCDGDGKVGAADAQSVLNAYVSMLSGLDASLSEAQRMTCDVNGDGAVDIVDAQKILLYYVQNTLADHPTSWEDLMK